MKLDLNNGKQSIEIYNNKFQIEVLRRQRATNEAVTILIPCHNGLELTKITVASIRKFTTTPYELWVIDNASTDGTVDWLREQSDLNVVFNHTGTHPKDDSGKGTIWWKQNFGGSVANAIGLEMGARVCHTHWIFVMHNDALPIRVGWLEEMLSKTNDRVRGVSTRRDPSRVHAMHQSGMLFDFTLFKELRMTFAPNMPEYDVGDGITLSLEKNGYDCYYFQNTFNDPTLLSLPVWNGHWLEEIYCDKTLNSENEPFYLHLGRGTLQAAGPGNVERKTTVTMWVDALVNGLIGKTFFEHSYPRQKKEWLLNRCNTLRRWYVDEYSFHWMASQPVTSKVLDVGGTRVSARGQFDLYQYGFDVTTLNISSTKGVDLIGDATALPFQDQIFDIIFCSEVLEHVWDWSAALKEFYRVLRPGGKLIGMAPFLYRIHGHPYDYHRLTDEGWRKGLEQSGFSIERVDRQGGWFSVIVDHLRLTRSMRVPKGKGFLGKFENKLWAWAANWALMKDRKTSSDEYLKSFTTGVGFIAKK